MPGAELIVLPPGDLPFVHDTKISKKAYRDYLARERALLTQNG